MNLIPTKEFNGKRVWTVSCNKKGESFKPFKGGATLWLEDEVLTQKGQPYPQYITVTVWENSTRVGQSGTINDLAAIEPGMKLEVEIPIRLWFGEGSVTVGRKEKETVENPLIVHKGLSARSVTFVDKGDPSDSHGYNAYMRDVQGSGSSDNTPF